MGYRSNVKIVMANKAYELLKTEILKSDNQVIRDMVEKPDHFEQIREDRILIGWSYVKWYSYYRDVGAVEEVLETLSEMIDDNPDDLKDYFYKIIKIGEDNAIDETTNDYDELYIDDFYVECDFSL